MDLRPQYLRVIGFFILTIAVVLLLLPPSIILSQESNFIGDELGNASGSEVPVRMKLEVGSNEFIRDFPQAVGDWNKVSEYESSMLKGILDADVMLERAYRKSGFGGPFFLLIMQSKSEFSFHPPPVCYRAAGYDIESESTERINCTDMEWVSYWRSEAETENARAIPVKRIDISREMDGDGKNDNRIVFYFYLKGGLFSDRVTMLRVSAPVEDSVEEKISQEMRGFMGALIPLLFEPREKDSSLGESLSESWGGRAVIVLSLLIPVAIISYPSLKKRRASFHFKS